MKPLGYTLRGIWSYGAEFTAFSIMWKIGHAMKVPISGTDGAPDFWMGWY